MLFVVYVFNFVDRQLLAILLDPIKQDLGASDTAMGFLSGFAFAFFYTFAGIPIARWADRASRRSIIGLGLALWSAMTAASGLARSFLQLEVGAVADGDPSAHEAGTVLPICLSGDGHLAEVRVTARQKGK